MKRTPGSKYAIKIGREKYQKERARHKEKLARRRAQENNDG